MKACSAGAKCARCTWVKYKPVWQKELAWLDAKMNMESGSWGLGCRLCHDAQEVSPEAMSKFPVSRHHFARYEVNSGDIRVARFRKHAASPAHRTAEKYGRWQSASAWGNWWFLANHVWMEVSHLSQQAWSLSSRCGRCSLLLSMFAFRGQQVELKKIATKASPYYFQEAVRPPCVARVHHVQHGRQIRVWPPCSYTVYHVLTWQPPFFIKEAAPC